MKYNHRFSEARYAESHMSSDWAVTPSLAHAEEPSNVWDRGDPQAREDKLLAALEENNNLKQLNQENELRIKRLVAQLARTEEAAKRTILKHDPTARRGAAQQLLDLDREVARLTNAKLKAQKQAAEKNRVATELSKTCSQLKKRLATVLQDQRRLVVQLGLAQQKAGLRGAGSQPEGTPASQKEACWTDRGLASRHEELERVAADLKAQVRALQQELLHPGLRIHSSKSPRERQQQRQIEKLQADLHAALFARNAEHAHVQTLEARVRQLEASSRATLDGQQGESSDTQELQAAVARYRGLLAQARAANGGQLQEKLEQSRAQNLAILKDLEGKSAELQRLRMTTLQQQALISKLQLRLGAVVFQQPDGDTTQGGILQTADGSQLAEPAPLHEKLARLKQRHGRHNPEVVRQANVPMQPLTPGQAVAVQPSAHQECNLSPFPRTQTGHSAGKGSTVSCRSPPSIRLHIIGAAFDEAATGRQLVSQASIGVGKATLQLEGLWPKYNTEYLFKGDTSFEELASQSVQVDCQVLSHDRLPLHCRAVIPLRQEAGSQGLGRCALLTDSKTGAAVGNMYYDLQPVQQHRHKPQPGLPPENAPREKFQLPPPYEGFPAQQPPSAGLPPEQKIPTGQLPTHANQFEQLPQSQHNAENSQPSSRLRVQAQEEWSHLSSPVRLLRVRGLPTRVSLLGSAPASQFAAATPSVADNGRFRVSGLAESQQSNPTSQDSLSSEAEPPGSERKGISSSNSLEPDLEGHAAEKPSASVCALQSGPGPTNSSRHIPQQSGSERNAYSSCATHIGVGYASASQDTESHDSSAAPSECGQCDSTAVAESQQSEDNLSRPIAKSDSSSADGCEQNVQSNPLYSSCSSSSGANRLDPLRSSYSSSQDSSNREGE